VGARRQWMRSSGAVLLAAGITILACVLCKRGAGGTEERRPSRPPAREANRISVPRSVDGDWPTLDAIRAEAARLKAHAARCRDTLAAQGRAEMGARYGGLASRLGRFASRVTRSWKPERVRKYVQQFHKLRAELDALDAATGMAEGDGAEPGAGPRLGPLSALVR
jgi:hypothetical protein